MKTQVVNLHTLVWSHNTAFGWVHGSYQSCKIAHLCINSLSTKYTTDLPRFFYDFEYNHFIEFELLKFIPLKGTGTLKYS